MNKWTREPVTESRGSSPPWGRTWASSDARVAAALHFAATVYRGEGRASEDDSLACAQRALSLFESKL